MAQFSLPRRAEFSKYSGRTAEIDFGGEPKFSPVGPEMFSGYSQKTAEPS